MPWGVALDAAGNLYIADSGNNAIRIVAKSNGYITTLSIGSFILKSPKGVAVPCASTYEMLRGSTPASSCAAATTA